MPPPIRPNPEKNISRPAQDVLSRNNFMPLKRGLNIASVQANAERQLRLNKTAQPVNGTYAPPENSSNILALFPPNSVKKNTTDSSLKSSMQNYSKGALNGAITTFITSLTQEKNPGGVKKPFTKKIYSAATNAVKGYNDDLKEGNLVRLAGRASIDYFLGRVGTKVFKELTTRVYSKLAIPKSLDNSSSGFKPNQLSPHSSSDTNNAFPIVPVNSQQVKGENTNIPLAFFGKKNGAILVRNQDNSEQVQSRQYIRTLPGDLRDFVSGHLPIDEIEQKLRMATKEYKIAVREAKRTNSIIKYTPHEQQKSLNELNPRLPITANSQPLTSQEESIYKKSSTKAREVITNFKQAVNQMEGPGTSFRDPKGNLILVDLSKQKQLKMPPGWGIEEIGNLRNSPNHPKVPESARKCPETTAR
jgi:hypothetical protein